MKHRGKLLEKVLNNHGMGVTSFAKKMGVNRATPYNWFEEPNLPIDILIRAGKYLYHDFSDDIPELKNAIRMVQEPQEPYGISKKLETVIQQKDELIKALEAQIKSLREQLSLKDKIIIMTEEKKKARNKAA